MTTSQQSRTAPKKAPGFGIGNFPARTKNVVHGGPVKGPGTGTSDSVPVLASHGEFMFPADSVRTIGKDVLQAMVDATHTPTGRRATSAAIPAFADGGLVQDPLKPAAARGAGFGLIGATAAVPTAGVAPVAAPAAPMVAPPAAPLDYANRNDAFNRQAVANTEASRMVQPMARLGLPAPAQAVPGVAPGVAAAVAAPVPATAVAPAAPVDYASRNDAFNRQAAANTAASRAVQPMVRPGQPSGLGLGIGAARVAAPPVPPAAPVRYTSQVAGQPDPLQMANGGYVGAQPTSAARRSTAVPGFEGTPATQVQHATQAMGQQEPLRMADGGSVEEELMRLRMQRAPPLTHPLPRLGLISENLFT